MTTHSTKSDQQSPARRKRTVSERQRKDTYSRPCRVAGVTTRSAEGRLIRDMRADLFKHVGGAPSTTQRVLIERAVMIAVQLGRMDAKALADGAMSELASREYLAWSNTLTRTMKALGLTGSAERVPSLQEYLAERSKS